MIDIMNITQTIENLCDRYFSRLGLSARKINNGSCGDFADDVEFGGFGEVIWGDENGLNWSDNVEDFPNWFTHFAPFHCFIWYENKYYDSECSAGCEYADQLPFYQRQIWIENTGRRLQSLVH